MLEDQYILSEEQEGDKWMPPKHDKPCSQIYLFKEIEDTHPIQQKELWDIAFRRSPVK